MPDNFINSTLFVVTAESFTGTFRHFYMLSNEICDELILTMGDVIHRIFMHKNEDIMERMSVCFESQYLQKTNIQENLELLVANAHLVKVYTESSKYKTDLERILRNGPLGRELLQILRRGAESYKWIGPESTRNRSMVTKAKENIANNACEELVKEIVKAIVLHLSDEFSANENTIYQAIFRRIDLHGFELSLFTRILATLRRILRHPIAFIIGVIMVLFSGIRINSTAFRQEVADSMYTNINENMSAIVSDVLDSVRSKYEEFNTSLKLSDSAFHRFIEYENLRNRDDNIRSEFQALAKM